MKKAETRVKDYFYLLIICVIVSRGCVLKFICNEEVADTNYDKVYCVFLKILNLISLWDSISSKESILSYYVILYTFILLNSLEGD